MTYELPYQEIWVFVSERTLRQALRLDRMLRDVEQMFYNYGAKIVRMEQRPEQLGTMITGERFICAEPPRFSALPVQGWLE